MKRQSDPVAISTNRAKSAREILELPSARFDEIETAARRICVVNPNRSSSGKFLLMDKPGPQTVLASQPSTDNPQRLRRPSTLNQQPSTTSASPFSFSLRRPFPTIRTVPRRTLVVPIDQGREPALVRARGKKRSAKASASFHVIPSNTASPARTEGSLTARLFLSMVCSRLLASRLDCPRVAAATCCSLSPINPQPTTLNCPHSPLDDDNPRGARQIYPSSDS